MSTITQEQADKIAAYLETHELPKGLGNEESACSAASINIALGYGLTDACPDCASAVIWRWMIRTNDAMPHEMRNSAEWKRLLPLAAGTGRDLEKQRLAVAMDWMWKAVLPQLQPLADERGFGETWRRMTTEKTRAAAAAAAAAADADADAAGAAYAAADAAAYAAGAGDADAAADAAGAAARNTFWANVNPAACLARMIEVV